MNDLLIEPDKNPLHQLNLLLSQMIMAVKVGKNQQIPDGERQRC
jgi:hypothetical protein